MSFSRHYDLRDGIASGRFKIGEDYLLHNRDGDVVGHVAVVNQTTIGVYGADGYYYGTMFINNNSRRQMNNQQVECSNRYCRHQHFRPINKVCGNNNCNRCRHCCTCGNASTLKKNIASVATPCHVHIANGGQRGWQTPLDAAIANRGQQFPVPRMIIGGLVAYSGNVALGGPTQYNSDGTCGPNHTVPGSGRPYARR